MSWTTKQISDLDNSMVAAQNVDLGTVLGALVGSGYAVSGSVVPTSATHSLETGLTDVITAVASLSGSPTVNHSWVRVTSGSGGWITIYSYKATSTSDTTPVASTGSYVAVNWIAVGEK